MRDLAFRPSFELAAAIRRRKVGSRELLDHYLARIERLNSRINAVVTLDVERARQRADEADRALSRGEDWGPLHGLPITVKDTLETAGMRTTAGAPALSGHMPVQDATSVRRLLAAGAVLFGKTNTPTFAMDCQTYNPVFGTTSNPWDVARTPGGSSGGSAAAIAAGLTGLELGSDIGGSIRNPAHYCGVFGHKPTHGIVPLRGHIPGPPGSLSEVDLAVVGPLGRSADDLALALDVLTGPSEDRAVAWRLELPPPRRASLRDYRVAAWLDDPACPVDGEVGEQLAAAVAAVRRAGASVDEQARPGVDLAEAFRTYLRLLLPITTAALPPEQFAELAALAGALREDDDSLRARTVRYSTERYREWLSASEKREHIRASWADFFRRYDVLLCPVMPVTAIPHDQSGDFLSRTIRVNGAERPYWDLVVWNGAIANLALLPATVAPVGRTERGLPVGIQIVGPYLEDRTPIDFARRLTGVIGGFEAPPGY